MRLPHSSKQLLRLAPISALSVFLLAGCGPKEEPTLDPIATPRMTMDLPVSLSGVVTAPSSKAYTDLDGLKHTADPVTDPAQCEKYFDPEDSNFMENGYSMTRFLVGLSQSQSCFADFIMNAVVTSGAAWVNKGLINLGVNANDPEAPSHLQIEQTTDTVQVWLYFGTQGTDLPTDMSSVQTIYLTWTGTDDDINGQYFMVNMPVNANDPNAPAGVRVDFSRTASSADNKIFLKMRDNHNAGMDGFRVDVSEMGVGDAASYAAKGLITFLGNPFTDVVIGADLPNFSATSVVDSVGLGASVASFNNFAFALANDSDGNGTISAVDGEFDLGSYQFTIADTTYFDPTLYDATDTTKSYAEQVLEWRNKSAQNAIYIADHPRVIPGAGTAVDMLSCMESDGVCDYNGNGVLDESTDPVTGESNGEWMGWGLGAGYFTDAEKCVDDASVTTNCTTFVDKFFNDNQFGSQTLNSTTAEPTDDRSTQLDTLAQNQLTSVNPDSDPEGASTFVVPDAPLR